MNEDALEIFYAFRGRLVGTKRMQKLVCSTLLFFPKEIRDRVTESCWFVSSMEDAYGYTLTGDDLMGQHLIFLSDDLFGEGIDQIRHTIAHEIGHIILNHRNSTLVMQTKKEIQNQEKEAEEFVKKYIS